MPETHYYKAYGLVVASEFPIAAMPHCPEQPADIQICLTEDAAGWDDLDLPNSFANWRAGPERLLLNIENVAKYLVEDGNRISIQPAAGASQGAISAFLTGSAFAVLLQQRRFLTIHASGIMGPQGAILFVGLSGVGKSTTLAAMNARGFEMVTDDVAAIRFADDGTALVTPSFSGGRVTAESLKKLGKSPAEFRKLDAEIEKFAVPIELTETKSAKIDRIVVLNAWEKPEISLETLGYSDAFVQLSFYTFRKRFYDGMGIQDFHFGAITRLATDTPVVMARRPDQPFLLDELVEAILDDAGQPATSQSDQAEN